MKSATPCVERPLDCGTQSDSRDLRVSRVQLECPECGSIAPPTIVQPPPRIHQCDACGARTPHSELRARKSYAVVRTDDSGGGGPTTYAQGAAGVASYFSIGRLITTLTVSGVGVGPNDIIVVTVGSYDATQVGAAPSSVTLGSNSLTQIFQTQGTGDLSAPFLNGSVWYGFGIPNGVYSCTATWAAAKASGAMAVSRINNGPSSPLDKQVVATDSAAAGGPEPNSGSTGALSQAKEVCVASYISLSPLGMTWDAPFTTLQFDGSLGIFGLGDAIDAVSSTSAVTASGTQQVVKAAWICAVNTFRVSA